MKNIKKMKKSNSSDINSDDKCNSNDIINNNTFSCDLSNSGNIISSDIIRNDKQWRRHQ